VTRPLRDVYAASGFRYRRLEGRLIGRRPLAVWLEVDARRAWLPRAILERAVLEAIDSAELGDAVRLRLVAWKCDEIGWTGRAPQPGLPGLTS